MNRLLSFLKKATTNPAIAYVLSRYGTYLIQFVNSLFIAVYLGPYYLGIWGFINLVIGYIAQFSFGISNSVNVIISVNKQDDEYVKKIIGNGMTMILGLSAVVFLFLFTVHFGVIKIGEKYNFEKYILPTVLIAIFTHVNGYFSNIFRVFGKIYAIAINQSLYPVIILFLIPFFRKEELLWAMLYANAVAFLFSFILYLLQSPVKIKPLVNWETFRFIQIKGWHLFIYNASFYLIMLSTNSFISGNYEVKEFGYYTFSYSLANVVLLLLNSISFLIFPKLLNRFASQSNDQIDRILSEVRVAYISLSHLLIHFMIMLFPIFLLYFPGYSTSSGVFKFTALTIVLYTNSFGYQGVLMAKGKEKLIAKTSFAALIVNIVFSAVLVYVVKVPFSMVIVATMVTYLLYVYFIGNFGREILGLKADIVSTLKNIYTWRMMVPFATSFLFAMINLPEVCFVFPFFMYIILNFRDIMKIKKIAANLIKNPNFVNI